MYIFILQVPLILKRSRREIKTPLEYQNKGKAKNIDSKNEEVKNPWIIKSIYEHQYFNCPVCEFKEHSKQEYIEHAFDCHKEAINDLLSLHCGLSFQV